MQLEKINDLIVNGEAKKAQIILKNIAKGKKAIARKDRAPIAELCRRVYLPALSCRLLNKIVRPARGRKHTEQATTREIAEYAAALGDLGAGKEAIKLLGKINKDEFWPSYLYQGFVLLGLMEWELAYESFVKVTTHKESTLFASLRAEIQMCWIILIKDDHVRFPTVLALLNKIEKAANDKNFTILYKEILIVKMHYYFSIKEYAKIEKIYLEHKKIAETSPDEILGIHFEIWRNLANLKLGIGATKCDQNLKNLREELRRNYRWHDARLYQFYHASAMGDVDVLKHLYFGTPFRSFKNKIAKVLGEQNKVVEESQFVWKPKPNTTAKKETKLVKLDVPSGQNSESEKNLNDSPLLKKLLVTFCSDLFRPFSLPYLFEALYPEEDYQMNLSNGRTHKQITLLRQWFKANNIPLEINEKLGLYKLSAKAPIEIILKSEMLNGEAIVQSPEELQFQNLFNKLGQGFATKAFSSASAAELLGLSQRHTVRFLTAAVVKGKLKKIRVRQRHGYRLIN